MMPAHYTLTNLQPVRMDLIKSSLWPWRVNLDHANSCKIAQAIGTYTRRWNIPNWYTVLASDDILARGSFIDPVSSPVSNTSCPESNKFF